MSREELIDTLRSLLRERSERKPTAGGAAAPGGGVPRLASTAWDERFLLRASDELGASLDVDTILQRVARLATTRLGEWCLVAVDGPDEGGARRVEIATADPAEEERAALLRELLVGGELPGAVSQLASLGAVLLKGSRDELLARLPVRDRLQEVVAAIDPGAVMIVPLLVGDEVLGSMAFLAVRASCGFDERDLGLAKELARRTAAAVDRARLYQKARDAVAVRDEVLGYVAHDIRSPLSAVAIAISLLARRPPGVENERRRPVPMDNIVHALKRMNRIIDDLLDVTRLDCGALALELAGAEPRALVRAVMAELAPMAVVKGLTLTATVAEDLPRVRCDIARIEQVIANLIGNALKFTPKGGRVTVGVERVGGTRLRFSVTDTGQGMTREELSHAFDRFWQAKASSRGTAGLGLAICRGIVGAHGGEIVVASEPGAGSTVSFPLPVAEAACDREDALRCAPPPDVKVA